MQSINPKIYHIVHIDKLKSIIDDGYLWCDEIIANNLSVGTTIGMDSIKHRRLTELTLSSHVGLFVGQCVPFYFCPRSVMLYMMHKGNSSDLNYAGGQDAIVHLEIDLYQAIEWANTHNKRWAFTSSNAGSYYFEDTNNIDNINSLDWNTINSNYWSGSIDKKQAEFLCEYSFPWDLVERIGVNTNGVYQQVQNILGSNNKPQLEIINSWYY